MNQSAHDRITFDPENETMEADFSNYNFETPAETDAFYDLIERLIAESGKERWYFLVNLFGTKIQPAAWMTYSQRGRLLNEAHSLGSVRYDAGEDTKREIKARAGSENFDANLFSTREEAVARIAYLRSIAPKRFEIKPREASQHDKDVFRKRITLHQDLQVMEADFSDFVFETLGDVHDFYDMLDHKMRVSGKKWYFLVNLQGTRIMPAAWAAYASRGKKLNLDFSLGSVRYDASPETKAEIERRANTENFDPNLFETREAALARIDELRKVASPVS